MEGRDKSAPPDAPGPSGPAAKSEGAAPEETAVSQPTEPDAADSSSEMELIEQAAPIESANPIESVDLPEPVQQAQAQAEAELLAEQEVAESVGPGTDAEAFWGAVPPVIETAEAAEALNVVDPTTTADTATLAESAAIAAAASSAGIVEGTAEDGFPGAAPGPTDVAAPMDSTVLMWRVVPICLLGWAVPGLGHIVSRRIGRGVLLGALVLSLFAGGVALQGKVYRPIEGEPLTYLAALGAAGVGVPYVLAHLGGYAEGDLMSATSDYGNTFTLLAGLLNLLILLDAYDVATGRR